MNRSSTKRGAVTVSLALIAAACGGGADTTQDSTTQASTVTSTAATTTTTAAPTPAVTSLQDVSSAVVRIVAQGSFIDPEQGALFNVAGSGSGFIISEDGLAVTNNHVVTGAAFLEVFVGGSDVPTNARILGVSECSDLAVIDLDGGGYTYLEWYGGDLSVGLDVYTAGFPLGDPEFTLTRGIISKESADGETGWASVDSVIEHDATINPGNSGGPLVTGDGQVVGVNYAGASTTGQFFAISREEALPVIDQLAAGTDVTSLGINGEAIYSDADGVSGVWVSSVDAGSPADQVGILPGDIVTALQGLVLGTDGTLSDYCDILRSNGPDDVLSIEVLRSSTQEYLEGRINESPLELSFSFAVELDDEVPDEGVAYADYVSVSDDSGAIQVDVPTAWSDVDGRPREGEPSVAAAPSVEGFLTTWDTPGMEVYATRAYTGADIDIVLDQYVDLPCTDASDRTDYEDPLYTGRWVFYSGCGGTDTGFLTLVSTPASGEFVIIVVVQVLADADFDAIDRILDTFVVDESF